MIEPTHRACLHLVLHHSVNGATDSFEVDVEAEDAQDAGLQALDEYLAVMPLPVIGCMARVWELGAGGEIVGEDSIVAVRFDGSVSAA